MTPTEPKGGEGLAWTSHNPRYGGNFKPVPDDAWVQVKGTMLDPASEPTLAGDLYWGGQADCDNPIRWYRIVDAPVVSRPPVVHGWPDREAMIADIDAEMEGREREYADVRGELLFRCRDALSVTLFTSGPIDPTPAMIDAGCKVGGWGFTPELDREAAAATYRAMRAAALTDGVGE